MKINQNYHKTISSKKHIPKNIVIFILIFISFLLYTSCKNSIKQKYIYNFQITDSISIYIPDSVPVLDRSSIYSWNFNKNIISFLYHNSKNIVIYSYNFKTKTWKSTFLEQHGINGVLFKGRFSFINDSCIIYTPRYNKKIFEININTAKILKSYTYKNNYSIAYQTYFNIYNDSSTIIIPASFNLGINKGKLAIFVNKKNNICSYEIDYPKQIKPNETSSIFRKTPEIVFQKNMAVLCFPTYNNLYVFDFDNEIFKEYECQTLNIINKVAYKTNKNIEKAMIEELQGYNKIFLYDKYNDVYYKVSVSHPSFSGVLPSSKKDILKLFNDYIITVSAIDTNFQIVASTEFNGLNIDINYFFINKKGLYIKSFESENEMRFIHFDLIKN